MKHVYTLLHFRVTQLWIHSLYTVLLAPLHISHNTPTLHRLSHTSPPSHTQRWLTSTRDWDGCVWVLWSVRCPVGAVPEAALLLLQHQRPHTQHNTTPAHCIPPGMSFSSAA